jgi:uncharacterized protein
LRVSIDAPVGNMIARLVDVHPDGAAFRVSLGVLNLTHRHGSAEPRPMVPGEAETVEILLDAAGYRFPAGHRIRLSLSTAYWPMVLPPPTAVTAIVETGGSAIELPVRASRDDGIDVPEPADPDPLPRYREIVPPRSSRRVERDLSEHLTRTHVLEDTGAHEHPGTGLTARQVREETWTIRPDDPLSTTGVCRWTTTLARGEWSVRTQAQARLSATATDWVIAAEVTAFEGERQVHRKTWERAIPRDLT